jgi:hypothetical protein
LFESQSLGAAIMMKSGICPRCLALPRGADCSVARRRWHGHVNDTGASESLGVPSGAALIVGHALDVGHVGIAGQTGGTRGWLRVHDRGLRGRCLASGVTTHCAHRCGAEGYARDLAIVPVVVVFMMVSPAVIVVVLRVVLPTGLTFAGGLLAVCGVFIRVLLPLRLLLRGRRLAALLLRRARLLGLLLLLLAALLGLILLLLSALLRLVLLLLAALLHRLLLLLSVGRSRLLVSRRTLLRLRALR